MAHLRRIIAIGIIAALSIFMFLVLGLPYLLIDFLRGTRK